MNVIDMQRLTHNEKCAVRSWTFVNGFDQWRLNGQIEHHRHLQKNPNVAGGRSGSRARPHSAAINSLADSDAARQGKLEPKMF
jgi:hypothetical protein